MTEDDARSLFLVIEYNSLTGANETGIALIIQDRRKFLMPVGVGTLDISLIIHQ